ncbi:hypothetical protein B0J14DRAFT_321330 [Halenospora varia]|nr:hypothetical protein B0J14DRAFT_321330 [Halenospora varia]
MAPSRKRGRQEMEAVEPPKEQSMLDRIRNMWQFANLAQWIFTFGRAVKIDENLDIEDLEMECMKPHSTVLPEIGLALLKFVSSHRGLTPEIFDEYTRRQYVAKAPDRNPFGVEEEPAKFGDFDTFTKIRVLQQLTQWTMGNPDRIRERMEEQKDTDQTIWRIEPFGWDAEDRTYLVLDDNRLYRRTDPPPPPPAPKSKAKKNSKKAKAAARASKRRRVSEAVDSEVEPTEETEGGEQAKEEAEDDGFGGMKWECLAVTLDEFNAFLDTIEKSRDPNEKILRKRIIDDLLPLLEKQEEARKRKAAQKERELLNLEKLATAKRSSRIAGKMELQKQEEEAREAERKKHAELAMAKKEQEKWMKLEKERESRMMTREQRLKEREARRILHEEELANLSEDSKKIETGTGRLSERHLKAEIEKKKQALEELAEEEDWIFDCICGAYGQIDDGTHSIACDKCNIWQHSKCVGVSQAEADRDDFSFICKTCERRAKDAERAKTHPPIKIKLNRPGSSSSPLAPKENNTPAPILPPTANGQSYAKFSPTTAQNMHSPQKNVSQTMKLHSTPAAPKMATWQPADLSSTQSHVSARSNGISAHPFHANGHQGPAPMPFKDTGSSSHSPAAPLSNSVKPSSGHVFSSPHPHSPTNLPPPAILPPVYTFKNGSSPSNRTSVSNQGSPSKPQGSPILPGMQSNGAPTGYGLNGSRPVSSGGYGHQSSPLASAPLLTPANKSYSNLPSSSPAAASTPNMHIWHPSKSSPPEASNSPALPPHPSPNLDSGHASALPPSTTGLSPTKHSPPRPTSNGSFGSMTPSIIPPVASLSPSFQAQILTPPVKSAEPDRAKPNGQTVAP